MRSGVAFACWLALLHPVAVRAADDAACTGEPFGEGQVKSVIDGRTLLLADGRTVRLAGIETPEHGNAALDALVAGRDVALLRLGPDTDRYGRTVALVALQDQPAGNSVQTTLLERGRARVSAHIGIFPALPHCWALNAVRVRPVLASGPTRIM